jgi:hypothetical protein
MPEQLAVKPRPSLSTQLGERALRGAKVPRQVVQQCEQRAKTSALRLLRTATDISGDAIAVGYQCGRAHERAYTDGKTSLMQRRLAAPAVFAGVFVQRSCQLAAGRVRSDGATLARDAAIATAGGAATWVVGATRALTVATVLAALAGAAGWVAEGETQCAENDPDSGK